MFSLVLVAPKCTSDVVQSTLGLTAEKTPCVRAVKVGLVHQFKQKVCLCQAVLLHIVTALT